MIKKRYILRTLLLIVLIIIVWIIIRIDQNKASNIDNSSFDTSQIDTTTDVSGVQIPDWDNIFVYDCGNGDKCYVKLLYGIATCDYYTLNDDGAVNFIRDKINDDNFDIKKFEPILDRVEKCSENANDDGQYDSFEVIDGEVHLIRKNEIVTDYGAYRTLDIKVHDLLTGEEIPYEKILEQYQ